MKDSVISGVVSVRKDEPVAVQEVILNGRDLELLNEVLDEDQRKELREVITFSANARRQGLRVELTSQLNGEVSGKSEEAVTRAYEECEERGLHLESDLRLISEGDEENGFDFYE